MTVLEWKRGDTAPTRRVQLRDGTGGVPNLNGITDIVCHAGGHPAALPVDVDGDPADGIIRIGRGELPAGAPARYPAEVQVTYANGVVQTFPDGRGDLTRTAYFEIHVWEDLDPPEDEGS